MVETIQSSERESLQNNEEPRNPVLYPGHIPASPSGAMPSLAQPQRADIQPPAATPEPARSPGTKNPALAESETQAESPEAQQSAEPAPAKRVRALPIPGDDDEAPQPLVIPPPGNQEPAPLPEARLEDSKTVYVVSDIVDALRADAGYEPLPRDPNRVQDKYRASIWARLANWLRRRLRS